MGITGRALVAFAAPLFLALVTSDASAGDPPPATPKDAADRGVAMMENARKAKPAETPEIVKEIRRVVDMMQPHVRAGAADDNFAAVWNEALTLTRYHGNTPTGEYVTTTEEAVAGWVLLSLPKARGWSFTSQRPPTDDSQFWGQILHVLPDGRCASQVGLYVYDFNKLYNSVGGENAKGLAEVGLANDRDKFLRLDSRSQRVLAKPLSRSFNRSHYYEVVGVDETIGLVRRRNYYTKGATKSYRFEVVEIRETKPTDDAFVVWQKGGNDPELEAVLASLAEGDPTKPRKK